MSTFCAVDDKALIALIRTARKRIVMVAPGLFKSVAEALCSCFEQIGSELEITLVLDPDEDVCRIGYGELSALQEVHKRAGQSGFYVRAQAGLRVGVLLVDETTLVWSPTPRAVESEPDSTSVLAYPSANAPNGMLLGANPGAQIARAVCAEGTDTHPHAAEIGRSAVTPQQLAEVTQAIEQNQPIPVDLARVTRVFSTKLQFVELKVKRAKLSQQRITLSSALLNADAKEEIRGLLDSRLRAFADLRDHEVGVPVFVQGNPVFGKDGNPTTEAVSEATLNRERHAIEADFLSDVTGFGRVIERSRRSDFQARVKAYEERLLQHSAGMRATVANEADAIINDALDLIAARMSRGGSGAPLRDSDRAKLADELRRSLERTESESPTVSLIFKEVTYEQTQDWAFNEKLMKALPPAAKKRLGKWYEKDLVARHAANKPKEAQ